MRIEIIKINHIQLSIPAGSETRARRFYTEILGLNEIEKPEALRQNGGLWFEIGDMELHLGIEDNPGKVRRHPGFEVENLSDVRGYLKACGIEVKDETPIPGVDRFSFFDPFGNRIEFLSKQSK